MKLHQFLNLSALLVIMLPDVIPEPLRWTWLTFVSLWWLNALGIVKIGLLGRTLPNSFWSPVSAFWLLRVAAAAPADLLGRSTVEPRPKRSTRTQSHTSAGPKSERRDDGTIVALGNAPYEFKSGNRLSFYITLQDDRGQERTVWGVDLRRVARETNSEVGQRVILEFLGKTPVDVSEPVRNVHGVVVGHRKVRTHRNTWRATVVG
ncbi:hypothetical protein [Salinicola sp. RZ23]|uniref:hypothetical protein n=1 Tax=Salinicola sp. RZ23 TaxID=1949087 RepID=UPI000DA222AA|nr:hypothetical protein [Salinicola sp. RZ23]